MAVDGRTRTGRIINQLKSRPAKAQGQGEQKTDFGGMYIPNHSGDHSAGKVLSDPVNDYDIVNKKYVDDNSGGNSSAYGGIYMGSGIGILFTNTTRAKFTAFTNTLLSSGVTSSASNDKVTVSAAGVYEIELSGIIINQFSATTSGDLYFYKNGSLILGQPYVSWQISSTIASYPFMSKMFIELEANDYIEIYHEEDTISDIAGITAILIIKKL